MKSLLAYCLLFCLTTVVIFLMPIGVIPALLVHSYRAGWRCFFDLVKWTDQNTPLS